MNHPTDPTYSNTPTNRLERLAASMTELLDGELAVVMLRDGRDCAIHFCGYDSEMVAGDKLLRPHTDHRLSCYVRDDPSDKLAITGGYTLERIKEKGDGLP